MFKREFIAIAVFAAAGAASAADAQWQAPRTPWGTPDLQGTWTNASLTSLERDDMFKGKATLSDTEAAEFERTNAFAQFSAADAKPTDPSVKATATSDPGGYNAFWLDPGTRLATVKGEHRTSFIVEPSNGKVPYTPDGLRAFQAARAGMNFDGPERRALGERCLLGFGSVSGPPMLPDVYNNNYQIVQTPDHVMILVEMNHDARIIPIRAKHGPAALKNWMGDSRGYWEGDTLVVETVNLDERNTLRPTAAQSFYLGPNPKITERFTRTSENEMLYEFEVDEPTTFTTPWRAEMPMLKAPGPIYEYACHEGNYALPGMLAGARRFDEQGKSSVLNYYARGPR
jgi:hypothetical protein